MMFMTIKELLSEPKVKEAIHNKMRKLEKKLERLASVYFGKNIVIVYAEGPLKADNQVFHIPSK